MLWLTLGIITAVFFALYHLVIKKTTSNIEPAYLVLCIIIFNCVLVFPFIFILKKHIALSYNAFIGLLLLGILISLTRHFYVKALKVGGISKTVPLLAITPLFTVIIGFIWLKELPSYFGFVGIALIISGAYILNIKELKVKKIFSPLMSIFKNQGSRLMFYVASMYGLGGVIDKFVIINSTPLTRAFLYNYFVLVMLSGYLYLRDKQEFFKQVKGIIKTNFKWIFLLSIIEFLFVIPQMIALSLTITAYVIALKRTSALFAVILAYFIFKEKEDFRNILIGTILLVIGAVLLVV